MSEIWEKFDSVMDIDGLKKDMESSTTGEYEEVPHGNYEVKVEKLELRESKQGAPMISIWFKIVSGARANSMIFYNQVISTGFGLHKANEFLKSLAITTEIKFDSFKQYHNMLLDVYEEVYETYTYELEYEKNSKGYNTFKIKSVFDEDLPF